MTQPWEDFARQEESKPWEDFADSKVTESPTIMKDLVKPTLKSAIRVPATVIGGLGSSMVGGVSALGAAATQPVRNVLYGTKIDPLTAANTELERWGKKTQYVQTPEEEKSLNYLMTVMKPVEMAGEGLAGLTELAATGDTQKATDVIEGRSAGTTPVSKAIIPAAATVGQASALFGGPAALHKIPTVKNMIRDIVYEKSGLKGTEGVVEAPKTQPPVRPVSDTWLKDKLDEASLQETLRPKEPELSGTYWDYLDQMEKAQRWSVRGITEDVRKLYERDMAPKIELPSGQIERGVEIPPPKPNELSAFDQMKLEVLRSSDPALWSATDRLFMEKLGEKPIEAIQGAVEKPEIVVPEQYGGAKTPEKLPEAYRPSGKNLKEPVEEPTTFQEIWEAGTETTEKLGFTIKDKRTFKNILEDVNKAVGEKGAVGEWDKSPEALAAKERLKEDLKKLNEAAKSEGKDIAQYLRDIGTSDDTMIAFARLTKESREEKQAKQMVKELKDLEKAVDEAYEIGDPNAVNLDAKLAILRDKVEAREAEFTTYREYGNANQFIPLEETLANTYYDAVVKARVGAPQGEDIIQNFKDAIVEHGGRIEGVSDEAIFAAAKDAYEARQKIIDKYKQRKTQNESTSVADRSSVLRQDARSATESGVKAENKVEQSFKNFVTEKGYSFEDLKKDKNVLYNLRANYVKNHTLYSDPFGANAAFKASKKALSEVSENAGIKKYIQDGLELADDYLGAISTRLANIDPAIKYRLRRFEFNRESKITRYEKAVLPLIKASNKMSKVDRKAFDIARKNGNKAEVDSLAAKYGIQNELATTRQVLDDLYKEARKVGFNVKKYPEYHPREVSDFTGLMEYVHNTEGWTTIDTAIKAKEQKLQRYLTDQEKTKIVNSMLRGYATEQIALSKPGQLKARVISEITPEIDKFYADSDSALLRYISDVTDIIEARRLFGRTAKKYEGFDIDNSIGAYILDLKSKGELSPTQERELTKILKARFHEVGTHGIVGLYKNAAYIDTMGSVMSAITQIGDAAFSIHKYGVGETAKGLGQAVKGKSVMSREDLGISRRIASEFSDKSRMAKAVDTVFKSVGLSQVDAIFKSTAINAAYNSAVKLARNPKTEAAFRKKLEPIFEKETDAVLDEFKNGEVTENTKLYVFNEVADIQPIVLSEMALKYLSGGNGRIFYMLKTYTQKMLDVYRNEVFNKIKTPGQRTEGIKNLISLTSALVVMNTGADVIKDLLFGRPIVLEDHVVDNVWRTIGASRYTVEQAKRDGIGTAALKQILPPAKAIDAAYKDIKSMGDGKGSELVQSVPIFGKFYYWWFGKGADKSSKVAVKVAKDRYYRMAMEDKAKTGEISQKTADTVKKDMRLSDSDLNELWKRIQIGDNQAYKVSKMPFDKALKEFEKASVAEKKVLEKILAGKYDRLSDEKKAKFDPEIQRILAEAEEEPLVDINKLIFGKGGTQ